MNLKLNLILRNFLFSTKCPLCKKEIDINDENCICEECRSKIEKKKLLRQRKNVYYLFHYSDNIRELIVNYKFEDYKNIGFFLSKVIEDDLKKVIRENKIDIVIPIPINKERYYSRGFNQVSFLLDNIGINYKKIEREKNTLPMHIFSDKNLRRINIRAAFKINFITKDKNILIVDDIITTGATVSEIIKSIEKLGKPKNIWIFAVAAAPTFYKKTLENF